MEKLRKYYIISLIGRKLANVKTKQNKNEF